MIYKLCFVIGSVILTFGSLAQDYPDLSDSVILYKYANSTDYQLVFSNDTVETFYYPDSTVKAIGKYLSGKRNGRWSVFYPDGTIKTSGYITDSSFYGKWKFHHPNGIRKAKGKFKYTPDDNDSTVLVLKMSGKWRFWNESGKLTHKTYFSPYRTIEESKYGKFKSQYPSGKTKVIGEYHKGSKIGTWNSYYENGVKKSTFYYQYKPGVDYPIGNWLYWDQKGNLIKKEIYKDGKLFETITYN